MSKIKLLLDVVSDMRSLADSIEAIAGAIANNEPSQKDEPAKKQEASKPKDKKVTLEEVRGVLAKKSQAGLTAEVRGLIEKYGGDKLSEVDPSHYADLLADAEVLGNG